MKKAVVTLFTLILVLSVHKHTLAQSRHANPDKMFKKCIASIRSTNDRQVRYNNALQYFSNGRRCTTSQLQDVCNYMPNDKTKYKLCLAAYPKIIDKHKFFNIYDTFSTLSHAIKLYHNTQAKNGNLGSNTRPNEDYPPSDNYRPSNNYPDIECRTDHKEFSQILTSIKDQNFTGRQKEMAKKYIEKKCLSMDQLKEIVSMFTFDNDKLEMIIFLYDYAPSPEDIYTYRSELKFIGTKQKFDQFLIDKQ